MPEVKDFLAAWKLILGTQTIGVYSVKIQAKHLVLEKFRKYEFDIKMKFHANKLNEKKSVESKSWEDFKHRVEEILKGNHIVFSLYGNPYMCSIGKPRFEVTRDHETGTIYVHGLAIRTFSMPKQKQES